MVNLINLPSFTDEGDVYVVVETPRGSQAKIDYDPGLKAFTLSKSLLTGLSYPHHDVDRVAVLGFCRGYETPVMWI